MSSIATRRGDGGQTTLAGGSRVSKASLRVEAYGTVDELGAALGLARSMCDDADLRAVTLAVQRELFHVGADLARPAATAAEPAVTEPMVERLTAEVHGLEALDGILRDWSVAGESTAAAVYDLARTVCRRAERAVARLVDAGEPVPGAVLPYLNRLSDLLWLFARKIERDAGVSGSLRDRTGKEGSRWSRAW